MFQTQKAFSSVSDAVIEMYVMARKQKPLPENGYLMIETLLRCSFNSVVLIELTIGSERILVCEFLGRPFEHKEGFSLFISVGVLFLCPSDFL